MSRESQVDRHSDQWRLWKPGDGLPALARTLDQTVHELEAAFEAGNLVLTLTALSEAGQVTPNIRIAYTSLLNASPSAIEAQAAFRRNTVNDLLESVRRLLETPKYSFVADPIVEEQYDEERGGSRESLRGVLVESRGRDRIQLRTSQLVALRYWGIEFALSGTSALLLERTIAYATEQRLASDIGSIAKIAAWLSKKTRPFTRQEILGSGTGRDFEHLVLDILNEHDDAARRAPLVEDYCEKTDLRVHVPDSQRRRGARAQVTMLSEQISVQGKVRSMPHSGSEIILICPFTLAEALCDAVRTTGDQVLGAVSWPTQSVGLCSEALRRSFVGAIESPGLDPRGPLAQVPVFLRSFVRTFVTGAASETTRHLRERENETGLVRRLG